MTAIPPEYQTVRNAFATVLGVEPMVTNTVMSNLKQTAATATWFTEFCTSLTAIDIDETTGLVEFFKRGSGKNAVNVKPIGAGSFGTIYKSSSNNHVYKKLIFNRKDQQKTERNVRGCFLEVFIQTVLNTDPVYGNNVCKITKLYRSNAVTRGSTTDIILFIKMDVLSSNLSEVLDTESRKHSSGKFPFTKTLPLFNKLNNILGHFKKYYNFSHRDLHVSNIMFKNNNITEPIIIDFGLSCLSYDNTTYSIIPENVLKSNATQLKAKVTNRECESVDLLILMTSIIEYYIDILDNESIDFIFEASKSQSGPSFIAEMLGAGENLKKEYATAYKTTPALFHLTYHYMWMNEGDFLYNKFKPYLPFVYLTDSDKLRAFICEYAKRLKPASGGKRKRTMHNGRRARRSRTRRSRR